jgi:hypothetical protein
MIGTLQEVFERALMRFSYQVTTYLPPLLVALATLAVAYLLARGVRWMLTKAFKGIAFDRFLRESGLSSMLDQSGQIRGVSLVAGAAYWLILIAGVLTALDAFDTKLSSQMIEATVFLLPKLVTGGAILLAGLWLAQFLGRSVLVWACNEEIPAARRLALAVRIVIIFVAVVVTSDALGFARNVFLAAFVILVGGAVLTASLAFGLGSRDAVRRYLEGQTTGAAEQHEERSLWNHL